MGRRFLLVLLGMLPLLATPAAALGVPDASSAPHPDALAWLHDVDLGRPAWEVDGAGPGRAALRLPTDAAEGVAVTLQGGPLGEVLLVDDAGLAASLAAGRGTSLDGIPRLDAGRPQDGALRLAAACAGPCGPLHLVSDGPAAPEVRLELAYRMENPAARLPPSHAGVPAALRLPGFHAAAVVDDPVVRAVADAVARRMDSVATTPLERADFLLDFLRAVPYRTDAASLGVAERTRFPDETLRDGEGDCEDQAILYASLARRLGLDVVLLEVSLEGLDGRPMGRHLAVGVDVGSDPAAGPDAVRHGGRTYHYVEATGHRGVGVDPWDRPGAERDGVPVRVADLHVRPVAGPSFAEDDAPALVRAARLAVVAAWVHPWAAASLLALVGTGVAAGRLGLTLEAPCLRVPKKSAKGGERKGGTGEEGAKGAGDGPRPWA